MKLVDGQMLKAGVLTKAEVNKMDFEAFCLRFRKLIFVFAKSLRA